MRKLIFLAAVTAALALGASAMLFPYSSNASITVNPAGQEGAFQNTIKDVAVTSIVRDGNNPPSITEGETATFSIGVSNNGTKEETFTVELRDDTENKSIDSQQVTLAAGGATTFNIDWDTTGATGGPPPPGPPTPGTIHVLTAVATLAGDTVESNNSLSLLPGIWVIAAPEPTEITFPENSKEPIVKTTSGLATEAPSGDTEAEPLTETFVGPVSVQQGAAIAAPSIQTDPRSLTHIFKSEVGSDEKLPFDKPNISTVVEMLSRIRTDGVGAKQEQSFTTPGIGTAQSPLNEVFLYQTEPKAVIANSGPALNTQSDSLAQIFTTSLDSRAVAELNEPGIDRDSPPTDRIVADVTQATLMDSLAEPEVATQSVSEDLPTLIEEEGIGEPIAPVAGLTETGTIRGRIKLQGRISSLGSYVEIGSAVTFADRQGYFQIQRPAGSFDLTVAAPGHLSHTIHNIGLEPGDALEIPVVTLPFGDADGDGVIDIYDLTVAAGNYGRTVADIWFR